MKQYQINIILSLLFILIGVIQPLSAQGYGGPLNMTGVDNHILHAASMRGFGGVSIGIQNDVGLMFHNPATLRSIEGIQISLGGLHQTKNMRQEQNYAPVRHYSNLSLLLEGLTYMIPDPDTTLFGFTAQDTVQRPYDDIQPNWERNNNNNLPIQAMLAVPVRKGNISITVGAGFVEYADLNHYYQHNNVLSPSILSQRPLPTPRPTDNNPIDVDWYQTIRSRDGSIQGYGGAIAVGLENYNVSFGLSGLFLNGSSDDFEREVGRGRLTFFSTAFRADSVHSVVTRTGTSDYSGQEITLSGMHTGEFLSIGFSVKLPTTIKRSFAMQIETDTTGTPSSTTMTGEDEITLPVRGTVGISITPHDRLRLGLEYEIRPYDSAEYTESDGSVTKPWLSSSLFRIGAEYVLTPWLTLRGGMRGDAEVFEPEGNPIAGEPVTGTIYSAGVGLQLSDLLFNITYENSNVKYADIWASAVNKNSDRRNSIVANVSYTIPWFR